MSHHFYINIKEGLAPWEPSPDAHLVEVLSRWDMPQVGLLEYHGVTYLFQCVGGQVGEWNLWTYHLLDTDAERALDKVEEPRDFNAFLNSLLIRGDSYQVALSHDREGIKTHALVDRTYYGFGGGEESRMAKKVPPTEEQKRTMKLLRKAGIRVREPRSDAIPEPTRIPGLRKALREAQGK